MSSLSSLLTMVAAFIVAIGILVSVHEYGHFWVARKLGIRVLRFAIGFGKPIWKRVGRDGVEYVIGSIPLGGYVKMLDEREGNVSPQDLPFAYNRVSPWKRILTLLAGPFANLLFAIIVYWGLLLVGIPALTPVVGQVSDRSVAARAGLQRDDLITAVGGEPVATREAALLGILNHLSDEPLVVQIKRQRGAGDTRDLSLQLGADRRSLSEPDKLMSGLGFEFWMPELPAEVGSVTPGGVAERAGLKAGDRITALNGESIGNFEQLVKWISAHPNQQATLQLQRGSESLSVSLTIGEDMVNGEKVGRIGVARQGNISVPDEMRTLQKYGIGAALVRGIGQTWDTSAMTLKMFWKMVRGEISTKNLSGPISIAEYTGAAARQGGLVFLNWLALISISIGIFNLLPIPMLDGGQVVYQVVELLKGSPVSERMQLLSQQVGVAVLLMLLSLTLYNDIARHLS